MSDQYQSTGQQTGQSSQQGQPYGQQYQQSGQGMGQQSQPTSQQFQPMGQQSTGQQPQQMSQQPMGQQFQGTTQGMGQGQQGGQFHASLPMEFRTALEDFAKVTQVAEWCADRCIEEPRMADCARACEDLAELAELNEKLIARDSIVGPQVAEAYLQVVQQTLPTLQQFQQSPHVSETLSIVTRSIDSVEQLLSSIGYQQTSQMGQTGQQFQGTSQGTQGMSQGSQGIGQQSSSGQGIVQQGRY